MRSHFDTIKSLNTEVVAISFGNEYWARVWLEETGAPFPLLLDPERISYRLYGLEYSLLRSWSLQTVWLYVQLLASGRRWRGIQGDSGQLGGDFIVDNQGTIRLAYRSHNPTDRPSVEQLIDTLNQLDR